MRSAQGLRAITLLLVSLREIVGHDSEDLMTNREKAVSFLKTAGAGDVQSAYDKFVAPAFIHHNLYFKGDRQSLLNAMKEASAKSPNKSTSRSQPRIKKRMASTR